jgi:hypothetical protein
VVLVVEVFDELEVRVELKVDDLLDVEVVIVLEETVVVDRVELDVVEVVFEDAVVVEVDDVDPVVGCRVEGTVETQSSYPSPLASGPARGLAQGWFDAGFEETS